MSDSIYYNYQNHLVVGEDLDYTDNKMLEEIINLFLVSDWENRKYIYEKITKYPSW